MSDNSAPEEESEECGWDDDALDQEKQTKLPDWHHGQDCLEDPVNELKGILAASWWWEAALTKQRSPADVMPALSGRWFGKFAKLGQIAVIQLFRKSPA